MRVALVSFEYPPDSAYGGIATYVHQAAAILSERGHSVEVFASSRYRSGQFEERNHVVNWILENERGRFSEAVEPAFAQRHSACRFDVVESPEYHADGQKIRKRHPRLAHVVKLHTPSQLIESSGATRPTFRGWLRHHLYQARRCWGALASRSRPARWQTYHPDKLSPPGRYDYERTYAQSCDLIVSPSQALADWAVREWSILPSRIIVVANPYVPSPSLLDIPVGGAGSVVGYFGRLEQRKGIADLVEAVPLILQAEPGARFRFVGEASHYYGTSERFDAFIFRRLRKFRRAIEIVGACALEQMPQQYRVVDVCVFPSIWENFPNVCLEAMAGGRAIVASNAGGMAEMLEGGIHGALIPPRDPESIAAAVIRMLRSPQLREAVGSSARRRVLNAYSPERIGPQLERSYEAAIALCRNSGVAS